MKYSSKYLIKELLGNGLLSIITLIISFIFNLYIARVLDIRDYGVYELELTIGTLFALFIAFATDGYAAKIFSKKKMNLAYLIKYYLLNFFFLQFHCFLS